MTRIDSTAVKWQVQVRKSRDHKWVAKGTFETRQAARAKCANLRGDSKFGGWTVYDDGAYGFGNTRIRRHISGNGKKCS